MIIFKKKGIEYIVKLGESTLGIILYYSDTKQYIFVSVKNLEKSILGENLTKIMNKLDELNNGVTN